MMNYEYHCKLEQRIADLEKRVITQSNEIIRLTSNEKKIWCGALERLEELDKGLSELEEYVDSEEESNEILFSNHAHCIKNNANGIETCFSKIEKIDSKIVEHYKFGKDVLARLNALSQLVHERLGDIGERKPHKCPVCDGNKIHKRMMVHAEQLVCIEDNCICCDGKGIVWN